MEIRFIEGNGGCGVVEGQYVIFKLGAEEFGLDILTVQEIIRPLPVAKLPNSPDFILGIADLRGEIAPIIDLKQYLNLGKAAESEENRIIVFKRGEHISGFLVDGVKEVLRIKQGNIKLGYELEYSFSEDLIQGIAKIEGRLIIMLDLKTVI